MAPRTRRPADQPERPRTARHPSHRRTTAQPAAATPTAGLLAQFLNRWYGPDYRGVLHVIADIDSLNYGLNLLTNQLLHGCLLTTERVADAALEGRLPGQGLRKIDLAEDYQPRLEIVTGFFARKGERERYAADHPLNLLWNAFADATPARTIPAVLPG